MTEQPEQSQPPEPPEDEQAAEPREGAVGPAEDLEHDPAYSPEDEGLRDIKGG